MFILQQDKNSYITLHYNCTFLHFRAAKLDEIRIYSRVYWEHRDVFFCRKVFFLHKKFINIFRRPTNLRRPRHSAYCAYWIIRPWTQSHSKEYV